MVVPQAPITAAPAAAQRSGLRAWTVTTMVVLFATLNWADKALIGIVAQPLMDEFGLTPSQIGFAGSAFFFLFSVSGAMVGFLGDRFQVRWILFTLAALWGVVQFPVLISGTFAVLLFSRIALGAFEGPATAMASTAVFQWFAPAKRGFPAALVTSGSSFAKIFAAPALAVVVVTWGWRAGFITMAMASFVWCAVWLFIGKEGPYAKARRQSRSEQIAEAAPAAPVVKIPLRHILLTKSFLGALFATFAVYGVVSATITWLPSYFEKGLGYSRLESGLMFGLPSIASVILMYGATFVTDRIASKRPSSGKVLAVTTAGFLLIGGIALACLPLFGVPVVVVAVLILGYGCMSVALPMMNAVISQIVPVAQLSSTIGIFLALQNLSGLIAPSLVGILVENAATSLEGFSLSYQIFGVAILAGGVLTLFLVNPERDAASLKQRLADLRVKAGLPAQTPEDQASTPS
ncbi:MFS transporter (plasmid) [Paenarthrobacter sp. OM7]|uniref:MFS transporter n=1 Tax=Paenarthrobacter sp. OM7 TaxID=3041264 RepID=UPI0024695A2C|nr:MFS transporter [Paenarthrobacter sp. OM7]WGM22925.1 MFS transporter [Paenarthrobacter sp. OM7]